MKTRELLNAVAQTIAGCRINDEDKKNLLFKGGYVYSWSSALSVAAKLPEDCNHLEGVVNGKDLLNFLSRLMREDVDISCVGNRWQFTSGSMVAELAMREDPQLERNVARQSDSEIEWKALPSNFYDCLAICDIPNNTYAKGGVFMKGDLMISTDNKRVNRAKMDGEIDSSVLLSVYSVSEILRLSVKFTEYAVTDKWMHFRTTQEGTELLTFSCNKLGDESIYPYAKFSGLIDMAMEGTLVNGTFPALDKVVALAQCFDEVIQQEKSSVLGNVISLRFDKSKLTVLSERGENGSVGRYKESVSYPDGKALQIDSPVVVKLSAPFLMSALKHTKDFHLSYACNRAMLVMTGSFFSTVIQVIGG